MIDKYVENCYTKSNKFGESIFYEYAKGHVLILNLRLDNKNIAKEQKVGSAFFVPLFHYEIVTY